MYRRSRSGRHTRTHRPQTQQQHEHDRGAEQKAQTGEQERPDRIETEALRDERRAPDHGGDQHQKIGAKVLAGSGFQTNGSRGQMVSGSRT